MPKKSNADLAVSYRIKVELIAKRARHLFAQPLPPEYKDFHKMELWAERCEARQCCLKDPNAADRAGLDKLLLRQPAPPAGFEEERLLRLPEAPAPPASLPHLDWNSDWTARVDGADWSVEFGDFPDEPMYRLLVNGELRGSMQDWPEAWTRPEGPGWKAPVKVVVPKGIDATKLVERYRNNECDAVWQDLLRLGSAVSKAPYRKAAQEVCEEMVRRSQHNISLLFGRLHAMGYRFWSDELREMVVPPLAAIQARKVPGVWSKLGGEEKEMLQAMKEDGHHLPMALDAWLRGVGIVSFAGFHPELCPSDGQLFADPLVVAPQLDFDAGGDVLPVSMGDEEKATLKWDPDQADGAYAVAVNEPAADAVLQGLWYEATFTGYLRKSFAWGGFPGWERYPEKRPEEILARLRKGLLPV